MKRAISLLHWLLLIASIAIVLVDFAIFEARKARRERPL
jgi:hypothetical protein